MMADVLRRSLAPVSEQAWKEIDETAAEIIKAQLTARRLVDCNGPHGWEMGAVNLGSLKISKTTTKEGIGWGLREVLPLTEIRVAFHLDLMELDSISRGARDADLGPLEKAAEKVAVFEETAIYKGFAGGKIRGILQACSHKPLQLPTECTEYPGMVAQGIRLLKESGIGGPYALVLSTKAYHELTGSAKGYPTYRVVERMAEGGIYSSRALEGGVVLSVRGGDFELTLGQDISIGFAGADKEKAELYFAGSFTFRVLEPAAAIELKA